MGIAVTKKGNVYQKNNTGKIVGGTVGAATGTVIAAKNLGSINSFCSDVLSFTKKEIIKDTAKLKTKTDIIVKTDSNKFVQDAADKTVKKFFEQLDEVGFVRACDDFVSACDTINLKFGKPVRLSEDELAKVKKNLEIKKLVDKGVTVFKKHPVAISAAVCGGTLLLVGCVTDGISNIIRRHKADKKV